MTLLSVYSVIIDESRLVNWWMHRPARIYIWQSGIFIIRFLTNSIATFHYIETWMSDYKCIYISALNGNLCRDKVGSVVIFEYGSGCVFWRKLCLRQWCGKDPKLMKACPKAARFSEYPTPFTKHWKDSRAAVLSCILILCPYHSTLRIL